MGALKPMATPDSLNADIARRLQHVRGRIAEAARRGGRGPEAVRLVAVSKLQPTERVQAAYAAGQRVFGENYVQEGQDKAAALPADAEWHLIGPLQTNKARHVPGVFAWVQTVDRGKVARALHRHARRQGRTLEVLLQVNWTGEASKTGIRDWDELRRVMDEALECPALRVRGLMTIPDPTLDAAATRRHFADMRALRLRVAEAYGLAERFGELSMGMSHDYEWAVEEGATLVRVGSAIFGERPA